MVDFAGIGKTDEEIEVGLDAGIFSFNVESLEEMEVIDELAGKRGKKANVSLRINPNIDAHTHKNITTGLSENKFGLDLTLLPKLVDNIRKFQHVSIKGLHFHIGSQITDLEVFKQLAVKASQLNDYFLNQGFQFEHINLGGGLGVSYHHPTQKRMVDFESFFKIFEENLTLPEGTKVHFELGRSLVAQCGILISKVVYVKAGLSKRFLILDGGMTDLIRPALYQAFHLTENICRDEEAEKYDVVGPICESTDIFGEDVLLSKSYRGDLVAIYTTGAYGQVMSSKYNMRDRAKAYYVSQGKLYSEASYLGK
jgi:diaminopimelate decarboxylase